MTITVVGVVKRVFRKDGSPSRWSLCIVTSEDTKGSWYGFGLKKPACQEGDNVTFEATKNAKGYLDADVDTLTVMDAPREQPVPRPSGPRFTGTSKGNPGGGVTWNQRPWEPAKEDERQRAIVVQHSQEMALRFVELLAAQESLPIAKTAKAVDKEAAFIALVNKYTDEFSKQALSSIGSATTTSQASASETKAEQDQDFG